MVVVGWWGGGDDPPAKGGEGAQAKLGHWKKEAEGLAGQDGDG